MTRAPSIVTGIVLALVSACETEAAEYCTTQLASVPATAKEQEYRDPPWWRPEAHPLVTDVASLGLRIELDSNAMRVIGADGSISNLPVPMSGIDYMGWLNLLVLPNGWFYGVGAQYDSAFKPS
ncbi:hypothetical protein [Taklimakanibacter deserti]|uniref:hypothetical protein n=1 Tax=Taklimakanibacter deserti TaxID=2267839 RepID=UPI000E645DD6